MYNFFLKEWKWTVVYNSSIMYSVYNPMDPHKKRSQSGSRPLLYYDACVQKTCEFCIPYYSKSWKDCSFRRCVFYNWDPMKSKGYISIPQGIYIILQKS
jgi:hypothetical protein